MSKVIIALAALAAVTALDVSAAQAGGRGQSSLATVNAKVPGVAKANVTVGSTSRQGSSLANLNVNVGNLAHVNATVGGTSRQGGSLLNVSALIGGHDGGVGGW